MIISKYVTLHRENLKLLQRLGSKSELHITDTEIKIVIEIPFFKCDAGQPDKEMHKKSTERVLQVWDKFVGGM